MRLPGLLTWRRALLLVSLGVGLGLLWGWRPLYSALGPSPPVAARPRISVVGTRALSAVEIVAAAAVRPSTSLAAIDVEAVAERLIAHPWIAEASSVALPPDQLVIRVVEREPVAIVSVGDAPWWVDDAGLAFAPVSEQRPADVPEILGVTDAEPERAHRLLDAAVRLVHAAHAHPALPGLRAIRVAGAREERLPELLLEGDVRVLLGADRHEAKLQRLEMLFVELPKESLEGSEIDLRFGERAVLRSGLASRGAQLAVSRGGARSLENGIASD